MFVWVFRCGVCRGAPKSLPPLHLHPHLLPIRAQLDPPIAVRPQQCVALNRFQHLRAGQAIPVVCCHAEQHHLRAQVLDPLRWVGRGVAALRQQRLPAYLANPNSG